jgi:hypothetical protein
MTHREISELGTPNTSVLRKNSHSKRESTKSFHTEEILSISTAIEMQKTLLRSACRRNFFAARSLRSKESPQGIKTT